MATRESIEFDFRKALSEADIIDEIAERLGTLSNNKFENTMQNLAASWKGDNASSYLRKGEKLQSSMSRTSNELHSIATDIRTAARRLYEAEMAALEIAQRRDY